MTVACLNSSEVCRKWRKKQLYLSVCDRWNGKCGATLSVYEADEPFVFRRRLESCLCVQRGLVDLLGLICSIQFPPHPPGDTSDLLLLLARPAQKPGADWGRLASRITVWLRWRPRGTRKAICQRDEFAVMEERRGKSNQSSSSSAARRMKNSLLLCDGGRHHPD